MNIMKFTQHIFLILLIALLLAGCQNDKANLNNSDISTVSEYPVGYSASTTSSGYPVPESLPTLDTNVIIEVISPQPEKTTVTGIVLSERTDMPIMNVPISLAEVFREGESAAYVLNGAQSPLAYTDKNGLFAFNNIPPGEYVVVIGNVEINDYIILTEPSGQAKVWTATAGNILNLETQYAKLDTWR